MNNTDMSLFFDAFKSEYIWGYFGVAGALTANEMGLWVSICRSVSAGSSLQ